MFHYKHPNQINKCSTELYQHKTLFLRVFLPKSSPPIQEGRNVHLTLCIGPMGFSVFQIHPSLSQGFCPKVPWEDTLDFPKTNKEIYSETETVCEGFSWYLPGVCVQWDLRLSLTDLQRNLMQNEKVTKKKPSQWIGESHLSRTDRCVETSSSCGGWRLSWYHPCGLNS